MEKRGRRDRSTLAVPPFHSWCNLLVGDFGEHWQTSGVDDAKKSITLVKFNSVTIEQNGIEFRFRQPAELSVDQPKAPHHVLDLLIRAPAHSDVLFYSIGARCKNNRAVRLPAIADVDRAM